MSAIVDQVRAQGVPVKDEDVARLSPLGHAHLNCLGRYAIASSAPDKGLRPLGVAAPAPGQDRVEAFRLRPSLDCRTRN
ncbi:hypothetical protein GCM10022419_125580 [Nonomuraea rosea]|uniref:Tn3 transposase DDE domain-containing protein n=1 Tax=Nonomuraea rosea TaxID=638574 RepID=A0ABP6ZT53_9ACTN